MTTLLYEDFARAYMTEVGDAVRRMLTRGTEAVDLLATAALSGREIHAFGNGGSSAIARSLLLQLRTQAGLPVHDAMMSPATLAYTAQHGYSSVFARSLAAGIDKVGLVVVASVSGRSPNVREAVQLCGANGVPVLALVGGDGAQMAPASGMVWATGTTDQQISEDAMLTVLTLTAAAVLDTEPLEARAARYQRAFTDADTGLLGAFLGEATAAVTDAICRQRRIYVLCPDGGPLALAGEHCAHNLAWDAPLGVPGVGGPLVICDPSLADMSAILNDHPDPAHGVRRQIGTAGPEDVVLLLAYDSGSRTIGEAVEAATAAGARTFVVHRDGPSNDGAGVRHFRLPGGLDDFEVAAVVQSAAHLLSRTTRAALTAGQSAVVSSADLMAQDLAPLRELSQTPLH
ncbi:SIS domain-containing protein [Streptomyces virginiae]|uniref:SIS domain-containing protein n=1 Tax=Streptomyces virginiae TaxID=1961 RepID=UPI002F9155E3|nr:SIS domain-containing protein [Streptomyces virginiae]